jgi:hypothetical protein
MHDSVCSYNSRGDDEGTKGEEEGNKKSDILKQNIIKLILQRRERKKLLVYVCCFTIKLREEI